MSSATVSRTYARHSRTVVVAGTVLVAAVVNLAILAVGQSAGGDFQFTDGDDRMTVGAGGVAMLTIVPLLIGMTLATVLSLWWPAVLRIGMFVGPALALATIGFMTIPADLDTTSTVFLSLMHVALVPITILGLIALAGASDQG
jgi:hypothetical protein